MGIFLTTTLVLALLYLIVKQVARGFHAGNVQGADRQRLMILLLGELTGVGLEMMSDHYMFHAAACIAIGTMGFYFATLSFVPRRLGSFLQNLSVVIVYVCLLYRGTTLIWDFTLPSMSWSLHFTIAAPLLISLIYIISLAARIADVKFILKSGATWNSVCLVTDIIYIIIFILYTSVYYLIVMNNNEASISVCSIYSLLIISIQYALSVRVNSSSLFVFWDEQERRFIESMRLNHSDFTGESPGIDVLYKNIYDRVIDYFDVNRPYLNNELTINDIVNVLYTNKLYISKAISMYAGRNFCQFVNYYRIAYAVELFRKDTTLKIVEVANRSGFNSSVSFSMAFRLYIGEKPGDWFRRERARLSKRKK